jgi:hypothetical protein
MNIQQTIRSFAAAAAFAALVAPISAPADGLPSYAAKAGETIHGTISSVPGRYDVYVRDDRGFMDHVALHDGTIINPSGQELGSGETVTITGHNGGSVFQADEIDTEYAGGDPGSSDGSQYAYGPYADAPYGYGYDYPGYGYGYPGYGYGYPGFYGLSFGFNFGGGYRHYRPGGGYGYGHGFNGHGSNGHGFSGHSFSGSGAFSRGSSGAGSFSRGAAGRGSFGASSFGRGGSSGSFGGGSRGALGGHSGHR